MEKQEAEQTTEKELMYLRVHDFMSAASITVGGHAHVKEPAELTHVALLAVLQSCNSAVHSLISEQVFPLPV